MKNAWICDYIRTPIGRFGGALASIRPDDLGAIPLRALLARNPQLPPASIDDVIYGCANQAGEDNRSVARMSALLAGYPTSVPGQTINRLCGSGMNAVIAAAYAIKSGDCELVIAGGVESMSRAPFVIPKAAQAYSRNAEIYDTTLGWRFINPRMQEQYGADSLGETAENVATEFNISRADQDAFALRSQQRTAIAMANGRLQMEIIPVSVNRKKQQPLLVDTDEHPRPNTRLEDLSRLTTLFGASGSVTAGNASGLNDGAAALIIASDVAIERYCLQPIARIMGAAVAGVTPRIMGMGPVPATEKLCQRLQMKMSDFAVIELNEAFAAQALACMRTWELADDAPAVNPNGGAIALGHPLGASGARITGSAALELREKHGRYALATMCIGVGQGIAIALETV